MKKRQSADLEQLCRALLLLRTPEECADFLEDLCTIRELQDLSARFATALLLDKGTGYQKISEETGVSTATISRVSRCLNYGAGGYRALIDRMKEQEEEK